jgi:hypothetical protein
VTNNYYVTNNNTTVVNNNTTVIHNNINNIHYANQTVAGAVTAVPQRTLANSEPVARNAVQISPGELKNASFATAAPVAPQRTSVLGMNASKPAVAPPQAVVGRTVVTHTAPPPKPVPFEAKQEALAKNPGRPLDAQTEAAIRTTAMRNPTVVPNHGAVQPMHPGAVETPSGMNAHPAGTPAPAPKPGTPSTPAVANTPSAPARVVPRPPQPGSAATTTPVAPVHTEPGHTEPARAEPVRTEPARTEPARTEPVRTVTPTAAPPAPARSIPRPPQPGGQPVVSAPVYQRTSQPAEHIQPAARTSESAPRASEPRPEPPKPIYQSRPPHEEQKPQSQPAPSHTQQPRHEEPKEHNPR